MRPQSIVALSSHGSFVLNCFFYTYIYIRLSRQLRLHLSGWPRASCYYSKGLIPGGLRQLSQQEAQRGLCVSRCPVPVHGSSSHYVTPRYLTTGYVSMSYEPSVGGCDTRTACAFSTSKGNDGIIKCPKIFEIRLG